MTSLARREGALIHPATGEVIDASARTGDLARMVSESIELRSRLAELNGEITVELLARMDAESQWTLRDGGWLVSGTSPSVVSYDAEQLDALLRQLEAEGEITATARERAVKVVPMLKVSMSGVTALTRRGGTIESRIRAIARPARRKLTKTQQIAFDGTAVDE